MASFRRWLDGRKNPWRKPQYRAYTQWKKQNGPQRLYAYEDLPESPVVFDFGGFKGEWSDIVLRQAPDAKIEVFEPHPGFAADLARKFKDMPRVSTHDFALGSKTETLRLSDEGDASSAVATHERSFDAKFISVAEFFSTFGRGDIDLVKINIEGGEYDLLPALIDADLMSNIARLQVQFHLFEPEMKDLRDAIRARLEETHDCVWCYPFVWEEWRRRA
jgi:FkbM family methyltransferase